MIFAACIDKCDIIHICHRVEYGSDVDNGCGIILAGIYMSSVDISTFLSKGKKKIEKRRKIQGRSTGNHNLSYLAYDRLRKVPCLRTHTLSLGSAFLFPMSCILNA